MLLPKDANEMLKVTRGNIFETKATSIVNTVNCHSVMGRGLALEFKQIYPLMFKEYVKVCKTGDLHIGTLHIYEPKENESKYKFKYIINFPTKDRWQDPSKLEYIETGMKVLVERVKQLKITSLCIPALGCQNGGLKFADVFPIILKYVYPLIHENICNVYIYQPLK